MLNFDVKRKIDTLRDILVGKVPDPKAQVEQITICMVYKFMDDIDLEGAEFGGRCFFTEEYAQYAWSEMMKPDRSGQERAILYTEGIEKMALNPHLPQLFRDVFKGAFVPYKDPETLNMFLKEISDFTYENSEDLGNSFEYLLSIMGSQGDAGQFRTPRHIIDMIVEIVNPKKDETILDPACGSAGFLVSAYRHILEQNKDKEGRNTLTGDERKQLTENIAGYDISPDMVRLARVNLYLHQFTNPDISEYDTLTSEAKWEESFDVILANPPFMTPKGGIKPHNRYRVQAKRSEVLFVDYIAEHLNPNGRAGIIVPEGIVFKSENAYKKLRQFLVEDQYLYAVISLPAGVFNPYSGVKTSILFFDKSKSYDKVLFVKMSNDGFDLGVQRRTIEGSELPEITKIITDFQNNVDVSENPLVTLATREEIKALDFNLVGDRYKKEEEVDSVYPMVTIDETFSTSSGGTPTSGNSDYYEGGTINWLKSGEVANGFIYDTETKITELGLKNSSAKMFPKDTVVIAMYGATVGQVGLLKVESTTNQAICGIFPTENCIPEFLYYLFKQKRQHLISLSAGGAQPNISQKIIKNMKIPLPPLSVQEEIVAEIVGYQKIVDSAREILEHYKPTIKIDPSWERVKFSEAPLQIIDGDRGTNYPSKEEFKEEGYCLFLNTSNVRTGEFCFDSLSFITEEKDNALRKGKMERYDVVLTTRGTVGNTAYYDENIEYEHLRINSGMVILRVNKTLLNPSFLLKYLLSKTFKNQVVESISGCAQPQLPIRTINEMRITLPPLPVQEQIVAEIEEEMAIVKQNKKLMELFQKKIQDRIADVWGEQNDD